MVAVVDALAEECTALTAVLQSLGESDYERPTNCPPWNLKQLVAHVLGSTCIDVEKLPRPSAGSPVVRSADYYRRAERSEEAYRSGNVDRWLAVAARFSSGREVTETFAGLWPKTIAQTRVCDPGLLVAMSWGPAMSLEDYLITRVIGLAAHGVDVAITLGRDAWTTAAALEVSRPTLVDLLGAEPPSELRWTDQDLLEVGTGRRVANEAEVALLGDLAGRFPLLS